MKNQITDFINHRIWEIKPQDRPPLMAFLFKQLQIIIIVSRNFTKDKLQVQAASLTYYTLLSVVPIVAMAFAVAKGFGFQESLEQELTNVLSGHQEVIDQVMTFANRMLENTQGGVLAGVGVMVLLWSVMQLLISIENSFNDIWQVASARPWIRKITEYFSIMLLAPILLILSSSITVLVTTEVQNLILSVSFLEAIGPLVMFLFKLIPYTLIWLTFTFVYMVMPNTKVNFQSALIAGVIAGTAFQMVEWAYIEFQVGVSKYNAIYGSFAALPLFLIWVNISWLITLIGAEVAYANQFVSEIKNEKDGNRLSLRQQHIVSLMIAKRLDDIFQAGSDPETAHQISQQLDLPFGITTKVLNLMCDVHLALSVDLENNNDNRGYVPARNLGEMNIKSFVSALNQHGETDLKSLFNDTYLRYSDAYASLFDATQSEQQNTKISGLI